MYISLTLYYCVNIPMYLKIYNLLWHLCSAHVLHVLALYHFTIINILSVKLLKIIWKVGNLDDGGIRRSYRLQVNSMKSLVVTYSWCVGIGPAMYR